MDIYNLILKSTIKYHGYKKLKKTYKIKNFIHSKTKFIIG